MRDYMDFSLEDVANFIAWNDVGNREGFGLKEMDAIMNTVLERIGLDSDCSKDAYRAILQAVQDSFTMGMKVHAKLQMQLLMGGAAQ